MLYAPENLAAITPQAGDILWYQNLDAKRSYKQSPAVGGGVDFTIRPWVRVGAEYLWSRYRREQRFSVLIDLSG